MNLCQEGSFSKGAFPSWSRTVHTNVSSSLHNYTLDNGKTYKYHEIQLVTVVRKLDKPQEGPSRETMTKDQGMKRKLRREPMDLENILNTKRTRQKTNRF